MVNGISSLLKDKLAQISLVLFVILSLWWAYIFFGGIQGTAQNDLFGFVYGAFSIWGGIIGFGVSSKWGGFKSIIGRAITCLSAGLLLQGFGQYSFWYLNSVAKIEVPYPSIPDIGFFGTIPFYIYAAYLLAKAAGAKVSLKTYRNRLQAIIIPVVMVAVAYFLFLQDYEFDWSAPLTVFLDFGYPMGQAIYVSGAILTYSLSRNLLGGIMKFPILILIFAFIAQFLSDYTYVLMKESYFPGSYIDYIYLLSYFIMSLGLVQMKVVADKLK
ncbi:MAG: hypothetical protein AAB414_03925 [Patescibacteria group bacterium]